MRRCRPALLSAVLAVLACPAGASAGGSGDRAGVLDEARGGALYHDLRRHNGRETGADVNAEFLFATPPRDVFRAIGSPRPHVGASVNTAGDTSQLYGGLTWEIRLFGHVFGNGSLGLSVHNGTLKSDAPGAKELGYRVLFRESVEILYRFSGERHAVSLLFDHISNANLAGANDGLETLGIRYGYRFR